MPVLHTRKIRSCSLATTKLCVSLFAISPLIGLRLILSLELSENLALAEHLFVLVEFFEDFDLGIASPSLSPFVCPSVPSLHIARETNVPEANGAFDDPKLLVPRVRPYVPLFFHRLPGAPVAILLILTFS